MSNEDKVLSNVEIVLGGKARSMSFSLYSLLKLQKLTGKNAMKGEMDTTDLDHLVSFVWAGLIDSDPSLDGKIVDGRADAKLTDNLEQIAKWLTIDMLPQAGAAIAAAFKAAMPEKEGEGKK